ncbi:MAG: hypothetical protein ACUVTZ_14895 [Armatimonadota bacterium]
MAGAKNEKVFLPEQLGMLKRGTLYGWEKGNAIHLIALSHW